MHTTHTISTTRTTRMLTAARVARAIQSNSETSGHDWYLNRSKPNVRSTTV